MWIPDSHGQSPDLIATSGDYLRLVQICYTLYVYTHYMYYTLYVCLIQSHRIFKVDPQTQNGARQECLLNNNREKVSACHFNPLILHYLVILYFERLINFQDQ